MAWVTQINKESKSPYVKLSHINLKYGDIYYLLYLVTELFSYSKDDVLTLNA